MTSFSTGGGGGTSTLDGAMTSTDSIPASSAFDPLAVGIGGTGGGGGSFGFGEGNLKFLLIVPFRVRPGWSASSSSSSCSCSSGVGSKRAASGLFFAGGIPEFWRGEVGGGDATGVEIAGAVEEVALGGGID